jgi:hypothetical protein
VVDYKIILDPKIWCRTFTGITISLLNTAIQVLSLYLLRFLSRIVNFVSWSLTILLWLCPLTRIVLLYVSKMSFYILASGCNLIPDCTFLSSWFHCRNFRALLGYEAGYIWRLGVGGWLRIKACAVLTEFLKTET